MAFIVKETVRRLWRDGWSLSWEIVRSVGRVKSRPAMTVNIELFQLSCNTKPFNDGGLVLHCVLDNADVFASSYLLVMASWQYIDIFGHIQIWC